jgi:CHAD domain-containing protein
MSTSMTEIERKYEADVGTVLPDLTGLPEVASESGLEEIQLEAEYYDTADLRLLGAGITLRRRRGGSDEGWHLKLPAGPDARQELHRPLGRSRVVPAEFARLVRVHARTAKLAPVARIATVRRQRVLLDEAGNSLAEVADDTVSAQSLGEVTTLSQWREIEVELTGGGRRLLTAADARLKEAGLRPPGYAAKLERALAGRQPAAPARPRAAGRKARAGDVVLAYVAEEAAAMKAADPRVRRDEPDSVHQMRVASRRLRSALQTFRSVLPPDSTEHLRAELKWLGEVLGQARDGEVLIGHVQGLLEQVPPDLVLGPVPASVTGYLAPRQAAARRAAVRALDSPRYLALLDELDALIAAPPATEAAAGPARSLRADVRRAYRRLRKRARHARGRPAGPELDTALHETRKAAKRARYAADALAPSAGPAAEQFAAQMKHLQSVLGDHHDTVVARAAIRDLGTRAHTAGENAFTYGLLYQLDAGAAAELSDEAGRVWREARRKKHRRWLA